VTLGSILESGGEARDMAALRSPSWRVSACIPLVCASPCALAAASGRERAVRAVRDVAMNDRYQRR